MKKKSIGSPASLQFLQEQQSSFAHKSRPQLSPKHETSINIQDPKTLEMDLLTTPKIHSKATPNLPKIFSKCPCQMSYLPKHMPWYFFSTIDLDWHETSHPSPPQRFSAILRLGVPNSGGRSQRRYRHLLKLDPLRCLAHHGCFFGETFLKSLLIQKAIGVKKDTQ